MEGIIVFKSKYGATRQYAEWLGETLQMPVYLSDTLDRARLKASRQVILGTSVYFGKMLIRSWIKQNLDLLRDKKLSLFVACGTPAEDRQTTEKIINDNIPASIRDRVKIFFLPGRVIHRRLSRRDRMLMVLGARFEKDPIKKQAMLHDLDGVKRENLDSLLQAVRPAVSLA